ncbi:MAG: GAF domain-containing protein [Nitrospirae bacterium]|nr:MAG: GAF domain-containing protein [Nitrospirota bacterium]
MQKTEEFINSLPLRVIDSLHLYAFITDDDGVIVQTSDRVHEKFLYTSDELRGSNIGVVLDIPVGILRRIDRETTREGYIFEGTGRLKNGEVFTAKVTVVSIDCGYIYIVEDITNVLKIAERATLRRREINTYNTLSELLSSGRSLKEILDGTVDMLVNIMDIDGAWIFLSEEDREDVSLCCKDKKTAGAEINAYEGFFKRALQSGRALLVRDSLNDPRVQGMRCEGEVEYKSLAGVPILVRRPGQKMPDKKGVLGVVSRKKDRFSSLDVQFLLTIANHLGVAIENAHLITDLIEKMDQIRLINEIASIINSSLSIGHIFRIIVSEVRRVIDFDRASINILDEEQKQLMIFAVDTRLPTKLVKGIYAPVEGTSSGWVAVNQKPWINYDLEREIPFRYDSVLLKEGIRSTISIPLFKDRPLGTLNFDSLTPERYSERDYEILIPIAKHLSVAIENALLFEEITREKRQWEKTFDAITDMVWIEDLNGKVLRVNRTVIEKSGRPELAIIKKKSTELLKVLKIKPPAYRSVELLKGKSKLYHELRGYDGSIYHLWSYPLVDSDGKTYGVVNYIRDVTEQKRLEQQLLRADKLASLGTMVAGIAHEINNPLGIIAGYAEALLDRAESSELKKVEEFEDFPEYLETINREIFRCKDILKSLLDFARPTGGSMRELNLNELIKEVVLLVNYTARKSNYELVLDLDDNLPAVYADPGSIRQVFMNIIMNSFYFMDQNGRVNIKTMASREKDDTPMVDILISDNGRGIDREVIERIFDPFFTTKPVGEGTGLGLSICHRIVMEHNGFMEVESEVGKGTTFHIRLPARRL